MRGVADPMVIATDSAGQVAVPLRRVGGVAAVRERATLRLRTRRGEWPSDVLYGLPWDEWVGGVRPDLDTVRAEVRSQLEQVAGVASVVSTSASFAGAQLRIGARLRVTDDVAAEDQPETVDPYDTRTAPAAFVVLDVYGGAYLGG